ncbi:type IX secretion system membrane protein PorP/SprF [Chitinophaga lutea]|uniref:Type IX secretion system membrane protein PorP/SprF n=1 Tax=Chitinophaga lutea TaxID=2488634 RepID=A0A3N4PN84_9BACT|nr:type IX secretion system membrane protein PorP/SprF [Chitinophaga lutea]RPE08109.1 type IX secretion system membrane protein PorP/SprF [Chitinophaga lutea]
MKKGIIIIILCAAGVLPSYGQQNVQFSQYIFNGLSVNPAYAGYKEDLYLNAIYRHQWAGFPGAPRTGGVSADAATGRDNKVGLGLQAMFDRLGPQESLSLYGSYSYRIPLDAGNTRRLCLGIGAGVTQYAIDGTALRYTDNDDMTIPLGKQSVWVPDARFGVYYYSPNFYAGASVMDLFSLYTDASRYTWKGENYATIRKTQHLYVTTGGMFTLSENLQLKPSLMVKEDFKGPTSIDLNAFLLISQRLWIGGSYRTSINLWGKEQFRDLEKVDAASAMVEFYATEKLRIGYAFDLTLNQLASQQNGSHEVSLGFVIPSRKFIIRNPRYF